MFAGRAAAVLLLVAAFAVAAADVARRPRSKPTRVYKPNMDAVQLLDHVMMYEYQWTDVLQEPIRLLGEAPYKGRDFDAPPLEPLMTTDDDGPLYNVREIVAQVTSYYIAIGSFVDYGAKAVRRALACYTFKQVTFQTNNIVLMIAKEAEPNVMADTATFFKKNTAAYIDLLSSVPDDDLALLLHAYWEAISILQDNSVRHLEKIPYPEAMSVSLGVLNNKIKGFLDTHCMPYATDDDFWRLAGVQKKTPLIQDSSLETMSSIQDLKIIIEKQGLHMAQRARDLRIVTMSNHLWSSLFINRGFPRPDSARLHFDIPPTGEAGPSTSEADPSTGEADPSTS